MTKNTKALILSALVFPGLGQYILKRYKTATVLVGITIIALICVITDVFTKASAIADSIIAGEVAPEYSVIRNLIKDQQANSDSNLITICIYTLVVAWLLSLFDILRLRKKET